MILFDFRCRDCGREIEVYKETGEDAPKLPQCECGCALNWQRIYFPPKIFTETIPYHGQGKRFAAVAESQDLINAMKKTKNNKEFDKMQSELNKISEKKS